jgi:hypothetical protein
VAGGGWHVRNGGGDRGWGDLVGKNLFFSSR